MKTVICPGSFDPVTVGHMDIIRHDALMFDKVIVVVMNNYQKRNSHAFSAEERVELLKRCTKNLPNVEVEAYEGLLAEYARQKQAVAVVKGLRAVSDFEYEFQQALTNKQLNSEPGHGICDHHRRKYVFKLQRCQTSLRIGRGYQWLRPRGDS